MQLHVLNQIEEGNSLCGFALIHCSYKKVLCLITEYQCVTNKKQWLENLNQFSKTACS